MDHLAFYNAGCEPEPGRPGLKLRVRRQARKILLPPSIRLVQILASLCRRLDVAEHEIRDLQGQVNDLRRRQEDQAGPDPGDDRLRLGLRGDGPPARGPGGARRRPPTARDAAEAAPALADSSVRFPGLEPPEAEQSRLEVQARLTPDPASSRRSDPRPSRSRPMAPPLPGPPTRRRPPTPRPPARRLLPVAAGPRMRVLSVLSSSNQMYSGIGRAVFELTARLKERVDFEFAIDDLYPKNLDLVLDFGREHGIPVHVGPALTSPRSLDSFSATLPTLLRRDDWDLVEALCWANSATNAVVLREIGDRALVYTGHYQPLWTVPMSPEVSHNTDDIHHRIARRADAVLCVSPWERQVVQAQTHGRNNCHYVANGVNADEYRPGPLARKPHLLFVGDLAEPRKRFDRILAILPRLLATLARAEAGRHRQRQRPGPASGSRPSCGPPASCGATSPSPSSAGPTPRAGACSCSRSSRPSASRSWKGWSRGRRSS